MIAQAKYEEALRLGVPADQREDAVFGLVRRGREEGGRGGGGLVWQ